MALRDFFKWKKSSVSRDDSSLKKKEVRNEKEKSSQKLSFKETTTASEKAFRVLVRPKITEKSSSLSERGGYVFEIPPKANKLEVKDAVEELYGVKVRRVNLVRVYGKKRFLKGRAGFRSGYKKALVFLEEGQRIEIA
jgi:large subunit ribosomal protein L23